MPSSYDTKQLHDVDNVLTRINVHMQPMGQRAKERALNTIRSRGHSTKPLPKPRQLKKKRRRSSGKSSKSMKAKMARVRSFRKKKKR